MATRKKDYDLTTERVPIGDLKPHTKNARNGDTDAIAESLTLNRQYRPIVVAKDGTIIAGNHTYAAAMELGWDHLDVVRLPIGPNTAEATRIMLADNRTADLGRYDDALLLDLLRYLEETPEGLLGTGYDLKFLATIDDDYVKKERDEIDARDAGDVELGSRWRIGPHTVHCGDSTDPTSWDGCPTVGMVLSDPPYGIGYEGGPTTKRAKIKDDEDGATALATTLAAYKQIPVNPGTLVYTFSGSGRDGVTVAHGLMESGYARWGLVWVKDSMTLGRTDWQGKHEMLWYGWIEGGSHPELKDRSLTTVLNFDRPRNSREHPTEKPVPLLAHIILAHDLPPDTIIADAFAGSGSTGVAAARLGYPTWQVEYDPAYARVCIARLAAETSHEPERL